MLYNHQADIGLVYISDDSKQDDLADSLLMVWVYHTLHCARFQNPILRRIRISFQNLLWLMGDCSTDHIN